MKRKNVVVGEYIVAKNKHGGSRMGAKLTEGQGYRVVLVEDEPYHGNLFCAIQRDGVKSRFWVDPKHFRKQK